MTESALPLAGLRVLDISSFIAAPAAAVVLGDWGADVIKVEGPDGDPNRRIMHDSANYPKAAVNYPWEMDSRNKRSIVLDLKKPEARAALDRLIEMGRRADLQLPAAGARQAQARLRRREAGQSAADLRLADRLRRDRPRPRPAGLRRHRLLRPLRPARRAALRRRPARRAGSGAGRPRDGDGAGLVDPDGADPSHEDRRRLVGRHVAARQRPVVVRRDRPGRPGRRLPAASSAARPAALGAGQHLPHRRTIAGCSSPSCARTRCGAPLCEAIGRPELVDDPRFARRSSGASARPSWPRSWATAFASHDLRALAQGAGRRTASPSASSAGRRTCRDDEQAVACGASSRPRSPRCRAPSPIRSASASPSSGSPMPRRRSASTATRSCARPA